MNNIEIWFHLETLSYYVGLKNNWVRYINGIVKRININFSWNQVIHELLIVSMIAKPYV